METPASIAKHPIHPMLIVFPIGLWVFSFISDIVFRFTDRTVWSDVAFYTMAGGIVGALLAAVPGLIDLLAVRDPQTRKIGWTHMILNLVAVVLFAINLYLRTGSEPGARIPLILSLIGVCFLAVSGWLGGELAYVHRVGVQPSPEPVRERARETTERLRRIV
jgi:uncharacterized membrane protein